MQSLPLTNTGKLLTSVFRDFNNCKIALDGYNNLMINGLKEYFMRRNAMTNTNPLRIGDDYTLHLVSGEFARPKKISSGQYGTVNREEFTPASAAAEKATYEAKLQVRFFLRDEKTKKNYKVYMPPYVGRRIPDELVLMEFTNNNEVYPDPSYSEYTLFLGNMPLMVGSQLDHYRFNPAAPHDVGGYFIIRGSELYFNNIERLRDNAPLVYTSRDQLNGKYTPQYTNSNNIEIKPPKPEPKTKIMRNDIVVTYSVTKTELDDTFMYTMIALKAAVQNKTHPRDVSRDEIFMDIISYARNLNEMKVIYNWLVSSDSDASDVENWLKKFPGSEFAAGFLPQAKRFAQQDSFINVNSLVNGSTPEAYELKYATMCDFVYRYLAVMLGMRKEDDRDSWANKRLNTAGRMLENKLFHALDDVLNKASIDSVQYRHTREYQTPATPGRIRTDAFTRLFKTNILENTMETHMTKSGSFMPNVVAVEPLKAENYMLRQSLITRIIMQANTQGPDTTKRQVHCSQFGLICSFNTPEGQANCGLIKSPTIGCMISTQKSMLLQRRLYRSIIGHPQFQKMKYTFEDMRAALSGQIDTLEADPNLYKISINGVQLGYLPLANIINLRNDLKTRRNTFDCSLAILAEDREGILNTSAGRAGTFFLKKNPATNKLLIDEIEGAWDMPPIELILRGILEYKDAQEMVQVENTFATCPEKFYMNPTMYTSSMIDEMGIFSAAAATVPFSNHQPASRTTYETNMVKQALSGDALGAENRFDTTLRILQSARIPIVETDIGASLGLEKYPNGICAYVAFQATADSQEDAICVNKTSLDNGIADLTIYHSYKDTFDKGGKDMHRRLTFPEEQANNEAYAKLHRSGINEGLVQVGSEVSTGDVLWNIQRYRRVAQPAGSSITRQRHIVTDNRKTVEINQSGVVDAVNVHESGEKITVQVRIRDDRTLEVGDKLCTRYAQKGIIGETPAGKDMITLKNAWTSFKPDIIYNPLGIPSRMTMGKLMEPQIGNLALCRMIRVNGSAFMDISMHLVSEWNELYGLDGRSEFDAYTADGKYMGKISAGPMHYQVLRHFVKSKNQSRGVGPIDSITHQPVSGIRKRGGLKVGEMETHALVSGGGQYLLEDRLITNSDQTTFIASPSCNCFADNKFFSGEGIRCRKRSCPYTDYQRVQLPYMFNVLRENIAATGIALNPVLAKE